MLKYAKELAAALGLAATSAAATVPVSSTTHLWAVIGAALAGLAAVIKAPASQRLKTAASVVLEDPELDRIAEAVANRVLPKPPGQPSILDEAMRILSAEPAA